MFVCDWFKDAPQPQWIKVGSNITMGGKLNTYGYFTTDSDYEVYGVKYVRTNGGMSCENNANVTYWGCSVGGLLFSFCFFFFCFVLVCFFF